MSVKKDIEEEFFKSMLYFLKILVKIGSKLEISWIKQKPCSALYIRNAPDNNS